MSDGLLTIAEIAKRLNIPETTARFYRNRFKDYLPFVGEGRRRRYRLEAMAVFEEIVRLMHEGRTTLDAEETISSRFPKNIEVGSGVQRANKNDHVNRHLVSGFSDDSHAAIALAGAIGQEIALAIGEKLKDILSTPQVTHQIPDTHDIERRLARIESSLPAPGESVSPVDMLVSIREDFEKRLIDLEHSISDGHVPDSATAVFASVKNDLEDRLSRLENSRNASEALDATLDEALSAMKKGFEEKFIALEKTLASRNEASEISDTNAEIIALKKELARTGEERDTLLSRLDAMDKELARLRKDRREMEKYLLDKINALKGDASKS